MIDPKFFCEQARAHRTIVLATAEPVTTLNLAPNLLQLATTIFIFFA